jgi:exosortase D (VPLPA-CTERM-specific)
MLQVQLRSSPLPVYALFAIALAGTLLLFGSAIGQLYSIWNAQPEYSYGILIPVLSVFLIWRERAQLRGLPFTGSWYGLLLILAGLGLRLIGQLSTMPALVHYALLLALYGLVLALTGPVVFRRLLMPLFILIFMVPLPPVLSGQLSLQLQLLSSQLGVWVIRAAGVSVFLEGNVIDLGSYQLEVAEACSGLRYLFPLMTLAFMIAYVFRGPVWKLAIVFLSSIPITVLMNSLRIGLIGITVDRWGTRMAEGLLHEFEGWVVFMVSTFLVLVVAAGLTRVGRSKGLPATGAMKSSASTAPQRASIGTPAVTPDARFQNLPQSFIAAAVLVAVGVTAEFTLPERPENAPARADFIDFPARLGGWVGSREKLDAVYLDALKLDDYLLMNYRDGEGSPVNLYVAYYQSQRNGMSVHSPRLCLPGGGWKVTKFEQYQIPATNGHPSWPVNRIVIEQDGRKQLVYYWFRERGRRLTNEYVVRWYLFWDALRINRTDGALVRVVAPLQKGVSEADVNTTLTRFAILAETSLSRYLPD